MYFSLPPPEIIFDTATLRRLRVILDAIPLETLEWLVRQRELGDADLYCLDIANAPVPPEDGLTET